MNGKRSIENYISTILIENDIICPNDLTIDNLSKIFDVTVIWGNNISSYIFEEQHYIILRNTDNEEEKYYNFLHELSHFILDDITLISYDYDNFNYYENRKNNLVQYLAIPKHMVEFMQNININEIAYKFRIPFELAIKRIENIKNKVVYQTT